MTAIVTVTKAAAVSNENKETAIVTETGTIFAVNKMIVHTSRKTSTTRTTVETPSHLPKKTIAAIPSHPQHQSRLLHPSIRTANHPRIVNTIVDPGAAAIAGKFPGRGQDHRQDAAAAKPE